MNPVILLVDSDLGFLFWLGQALDQAGYEAFPAMTVSDAATLLRELHLTVDLLILNCSSEGAETFLNMMRRTRKFLKTICLDGDDHLGCINGVDAVLRPPAEITDESRSQWVQAVRALLSATSAAS
jgi:ActR/RegA family two-component response regulator